MVKMVDMKKHRQRFHAFYNASNITGSVIVQGVNHGTIIVTNKESVSGFEAELLRIFCNLDIKRRMKLMGFAFDMETESISG